MPGAGTSARGCAPPPHLQHAPHFSGRAGGVRGPGGSGSGDGGRSRRLQFAFQRRRQLCRHPGAAPPVPLNINACPTLCRGTCHGQTAPPRLLAGLGSHPGTAAWAGPPQGCARRCVCGGNTPEPAVPPPTLPRAGREEQGKGGGTVGCGEQRAPRAPVVGEAGGRGTAAPGGCPGGPGAPQAPTVTGGSQQEQPGSRFGAGFARECCGESGSAHWHAPPRHHRPRRTPPSPPQPLLPTAAEDVPLITRVPGGTGAGEGGGHGPGARLEPQPKVQSRKVGGD